jgi:GT2 family glycosyltransferase/glycosyltransferase involved in cell wall biosynthesis
MDSSDILRKLADSAYFDANWYLQQYPDVAAAGVDPALHYLTFGAAEGRLPGGLFDDAYYLSQLSGPLQYASALLHYLAEGEPQGLQPVRRWQQAPWWQQLQLPDPIQFDVPILMERLAQSPAVTVIIPVFNALDAVARCLQSVAAHSAGVTQLIVIDDASTDPGVVALLANFTAFPHFHWQRNTTNLGFSGTVNAGIRLAMALDADADIVLLNSDTEVYAGWLRQLRVAACSADDIATVTAVSNQAGPFSVPDEQHQWPVEPAVFAGYARLCQQGAVADFPEVPTGHGFCLYIRRQALEQTGLFDAVAFPRGYGEENDFCMRSRQAGWRHLIAPRAFVYHQRAASFGAERSALLAAGAAVLQQRYPDYSSLVQAAFTAAPVQAMRQRARVLAGVPPALMAQAKPRFLLILPPGQHSNELNDAPERGDYECFVVTTLATELQLHCAAPDSLPDAASLCSRSLLPDQPHRAQLLCEWILQWAIDEVACWQTDPAQSLLADCLQRLGVGFTAIVPERGMSSAAGEVSPEAADAAYVAASDLFDADYYLAQNPDVAAAGVDPLQHYLQLGGFEGRAASASFYTAAYLAKYPDVALSGLNPLIHYLRYGQALGRTLDICFNGWQASRSGPVVLLAGHAAGEVLFGAERSLLDVVQALDTLGCQVIVTLPQAENQAYIEQLRPYCQALVVFPYRWWQHDRPADTAALDHFRRVMQQYRVQILHANTLVHFEALLAARELGIKTVLHVRELPALDPDLCQAMAATPEQLLMHVQQHADLVIANSHFTASQFPGCRQMVVVPNTLDCDQFALAPLQAATELRVALISSNSAKKGLTDFVALARLAEQQQLPIKCLLIGPDNEQKQQLLQQQRLGELPGCLELAPYYQHPAQALQQTDIVLNLSHFQESFGRTVAEAMAAGRVVIAYRWGALPELIRHGETGFLVPFADIDGVIVLIQQLLAQPQRLLQVGHAARQYARQEFTGQHFCRQLAAAYRLMDL